MRVQDMERGAVMFFVEGMFMFIPAIVVGQQFFTEVKLLKKLNKSLTTKSIPFFVFGFMLLAIMSRMVYGVLCFVWNVGEPNDRPETWGLYIWGVHLYTIQYFFMLLCWVKLVVVFYLNANINFSRESLVDKIFIVVIIVTSCYYLAISILDYYIDRNVADYLWRVGFSIICLLVSVSFLYYGTIVTKKLLKSKKQLDMILLTKVKGLLFNMFVMGILCCLLPLIYLWVGKGKPAQDWINFTLFCSEIFNITTVLVIFGRTPIFINMRTKLTFPDMHVSKNQTNSGGTSMNSLSGSNISEGISIIVEEQ